MIVASVVPNFLMGIIFGSGILGVMMLDGGFYRLATDIPKPFWKYPLQYISFHKYAYQWLCKNEFQGLTFTTSNNQGMISGDEILRNLWQMEISYSKWVDFAILGEMTLVYRIMFLIIIKSFEMVKPLLQQLSVLKKKFGSLKWLGVGAVRLISLLGLWLMTKYTA